MFKKIIFIAFILSLGTTVVHAEEKSTPSLSEGIPGVISDLKPYLQVRPRYEYVNVRGSARSNAKAVTLKTALGLKAGKIFNLDGLRGQLEVTNVSAFADKYYDSSSARGGNNLSQYQVVIDPPITRVTQGYAAYTYNDTTLTAGRKIVTMDDHRHIGSVGWRQMPQTFGVVSLGNKSIENLSLYAAYVKERKGIKDEFNNSYKNASVFLHASYEVCPPLKITGYGYLIEDFHNTYGAMLSGNRNYDDFKISYLAEYAQQTSPTYTDAFNKSTTKISANFYRFGLGVKSHGFILRGDYDVMGAAKGSSAKAFTTPYATLHKFNGWSDVMLGQAANGGNLNGLRDMSLTVGYADKKLGKFLAIYHDFDQAKNTSMNYGSEVDVLYTRGVFVKGLKFLGKAAFYKRGNSGISGSDNTTKYWLQLAYTFK